MAQADLILICKITKHPGKYRMNRRKFLGSRIKNDVEDAQRARTPPFISLKAVANDAKR